jgi:hypothetical protein
VSELEGADALLRRLRAIGDTHAMLRVIQLEAVAEAKRLVPRKTGALGRSIAPGALGRTSALVEARMPYAAPVELGSRPHVIKPKRAKVLAWPSGGNRRLSGRSRTKGGKPTGPHIFARVVHHPGAKPHPYLMPGAIRALKRGGFRNIITKQWNDAA